jgi:hypothetical protein
MKSLLAVAALVLLAACTTPTPYQPMAEGRSDGFSDTQIASDRYRVAFTGNSRTPRETVDLYLLYRAAEVTLENGGDGFVFTTRDTKTRTSYVTTGSGIGYPRLFPHRDGARLHSGVFAGFDPVQTVPVRRFEAFAEIRTFKGPAPEGADAYDAQDVIASLGQKIVLPGAE